MRDMSKGCARPEGVLYFPALSLQLISFDSNQQYCWPAGVRTPIKCSHPTSLLFFFLFWTGKQNTRSNFIMWHPPSGQCSRPAHLAVLSPLSSWHPAAVWRWRTRCLLPRIQLESVWCNHKLQREHPDSAPVSAPTMSFLWRMRGTTVTFHLAGLIWTKLCFLRVPVGQIRTMLTQHWPEPVGPRSMMLLFSSLMSVCVESRTSPPLLSWGVCWLACCCMDAPRAFPWWLIPAICSSSDTVSKVEVLGVILTDHFTDTEHFVLDNLNLPFIQVSDWV